MFEVIPNNYYSTYESMYTVYLGTYDLRFSTSLPSINMSVSGIIRNANFSDSTFLDDIALLKLSSPVTLNNYIQVACLPNTSYYPSGIEISAYIVGWGDL